LAFADAFKVGDSPGELFADSVGDLRGYARVGVLDGNLDQTQIRE